MKRILPIVLVFTVILSCLGGCGVTTESDGLKVVCTIFPVYDWMRQLTEGSDSIKLTLIADNGVDMHSYQPTTGDIVEITACDMFVYVGGESDKWVEEVLSQSVNEKMTVIDLMDEMGGSVLENAGDGHSGHEEHEHGSECVTDEHIWLSPVNAQMLCQSLCQQLCALDEANAALYTANCEKYAEELSALDGSYRQAVESGKVSTLLFADRFPFRYLTTEYGLDYHAAFDGCSAETEASFDTVAALSAAIDRHGLECVIILEGSDDSLARTVIDGTQTGSQCVLTMDSMQSVTAGDISDGVTYISVMESNLETLRQALGCE